MPGLHQAVGIGIDPVSLGLSIAGGGGGGRGGGGGGQHRGDDSSGGEGVEAAGTGAVHHAVCVRLLQACDAPAVHHPLCLLFFLLLAAFLRLRSNTQLSRGKAHISMSTLEHGLADIKEHHKIKIF